VAAARPDAHDLARQDVDPVQPVRAPGAWFEGGEEGWVGAHRVHRRLPPVNDTPPGDKGPREAHSTRSNDRRTRAEGDGAVAPPAPVSRIRPVILGVSPSRRQFVSFQDGGTARRAPTLPGAVSIGEPLWPGQQVVRQTRMNAGRLRGLPTSVPYGE